MTKNTILICSISVGLFMIIVISSVSSAPQIDHYVPTLKINVVLNLLGVDWIDKPTITVMWNGDTKSKTIDVSKELKSQINMVYEDPIITTGFQFRTPEDMQRHDLLRTGYKVCIDSESLYEPVCYGSQIYKIAEPNQITIKFAKSELKPVVSNVTEVFD